VQDDRVVYGGGAAEIACAIATSQEADKVSCHALMTNIKVPDCTDCVLRHFFFSEKNCHINPNESQCFVLGSLTFSSFIVFRLVSMAIGMLEVTTHEIQWDWMIIPSSIN
jgi:hypothetical protein